MVNRQWLLQFVSAELPSQRAADVRVFGGGINTGPNVEAGAGGRTGGAGREGDQLWNTLVRSGIMFMTITYAH